MSMEYRLKLLGIENIINAVINLMVRPVESDAMTEHPRFNLI